MQNLLKILLRYSNFLVFIALEVAAFLLIYYNNAYPRSSLFSTANDAVAWQEEQITELRSYFSLKSQNEQLALENAVLDQLHNYLTINRGSHDGIQRGQGVRNEEGAVGIVRTVGPNYSVVLPLINTHINLSCRFLKNDYVGTLQWDGKDCRFAQLADVAAHMVVNPGDTIVTSGLSPVFPEGIPVGIVENSVLKTGDAYHTIRVRLYTNFKRLKYVELVQNEHLQELEELQNGLD